jgi:hypothetical protein
VVAEIAGLHAQIMSSAELTAWARVDSLERGAVGEAMLAAIEQPLDGQVLSREVARRTGSPELGSKLRSGWGPCSSRPARAGSSASGPATGSASASPGPTSGSPAGARRTRRRRRRRNGLGACHRPR